MTDNQFDWGINPSTIPAALTTDQVIAWNGTTNEIQWRTNPNFIPMTEPRRFQVDRMIIKSENDFLLLEALRSWNQIERGLSFEDIVIDMAYPIHKKIVSKFLKKGILHEILEEKNPPGIGGNPFTIQVNPDWGTTLTTYGTTTGSGTTVFNL